MATQRNDVGFYKNGIENKVSKERIPFDIFLENIRNGHWQDLVLPIRSIADKKARDQAKKAAHYVTLSGVFSERTDAGLMEHSGMLGVDADDLPDPEAVKDSLRGDPYVLAIFRSISGRGLCIIFKVVPAKHREAFAGISEYLFKTYNLVTDPTSVNPSRARFVSFDPHLYLNENALRFTLYPKQKQQKPVERIVFAQDDFEALLQQVQERHLNLTENYHDWLRIGFAIAHKFGEGGRQYFHVVSQYSAKYDARLCDRQYAACLKAKGQKEATIATFYYYCKEAGLQLYSERTKKIAYSAAQGKKGGLSAATVAENLAKFEGITNAEEIIAQVMDGNIQINEDTLLDQLELWLRQNYPLQRNEITRYIELDGVPLKQKDFNTMYVKAKKVFDKLTYELFDRLVNSDFTTVYNPILNFFEQHKDIETDTENTPLLKRLFSTIKSSDPEFVFYFGAKWFVGAISAAYGEHSPLLLVLCGAGNTGKTEFFRRLLPKELSLYYAESKLDAGKDDELLMTQKWFIMDDEMGGKSKKEDARLKELTSKQTFSLREPYGRNNVDLNRLAVLCGTTNENEVLRDPTAQNRRIIPILVQAIDHEAYNSIDKTALLLEVHALYKSGFNWRLDKYDIAYLGKDEGHFTVATSEAELIQKYFTKGEQQLTATDIKVLLEKHTNQRLSLDRIGKELKRLQYEQKVVKVNSSTKRVYLVKWQDPAQAAEFTPPQAQDDEF